MTNQPTPTANHREQLRLSWLREVLNPQEFGIAAASTDASFRSYWRVQLPERSLILMDAPPEREDCAPFLEVAAQLRAGGLHAPEVVASDQRLGLVLLEDLGNELYARVLSERSADQLYADALDALVTMAQLDSSRLPRYDEKLLHTELSLFRDWLWQRHLGKALHRQFVERWEQLCQLLVDNALTQPQVLVHRDYHSRNLLRVSDNNPGIIDFQDAVAGPVTYDAVSLLRDCYVKWPAARVNDWADGYRQRVVEAGLCQADAPTWQYWFDLMGVQRHLKAAGIFCRLYYRDGKAGYLADIPRTLSYLAEVCLRHEALSWFGELVRAEVLPECERALTA